MSVRPYAAYKDSGEAWIGDIPAGWAVLPLKRVAAVSYGLGQPPEYQIEGTRFLRATNVNRGVLSTEGLVYVDEATLPASRLTRLAPDDIVVVRSGAYTGDSAIVTSDWAGAIAGFDMVVRVRQGCLPRFVAFSLLSKYILEGQINLLRMRAAQPHLNAEELGEIAFVKPSLAEQSAIAAFLDRETGKIDALVAEQERLIALLKEKRQAVISQAVTKGLNPNAKLKLSGVEWLGEVPEGWKVVRLGALFREAMDDGEHDLPVLSVSIHDGVSDRELSDSEMDRKVSRSEDRTKYKKVSPGDLVYNMMRAWQGGFGTVAVAGMVSPAYVVARPQSPIRTEYVELALRTPKAVEEMRRHSRGVTDFRLRLYWDEFKQICIPFPPLREQDEILQAVGLERDRSDMLAAQAEVAIALLKERRAAIISAAVTGKIDVRSTVLAEAAG